MVFLSQELRKRNTAIERLLREIKQVEEVFSERVKRLLKTQEEISAVFNEVADNGFVPVTSDNPLAVSISSLKQRGYLNSINLQRIVKSRLEEINRDADNAPVGDSQLQDYFRPRLHRTIQAHPSYVSGLDISICGKIIASAGQDTTINLWSAETGLIIRTLNGHSDWVRSVRFSPSDTQLVSASFDKTVKVWNVETGECVRTLRGHAEEVLFSMFSPDNRLVASASADTTVKVWRSSRWCLQSTFTGHTDAVRCLAFTEDSNFVISGGFDERLIIWNLRTGDRLFLPRYIGVILAVAVYNDLIISGGNWLCLLYTSDAADE